MSDDEIMAVFDQANTPTTLVTAHAEWHKAILIRFGRLMLAAAAPAPVPEQSAPVSRGRCSQGKRCLCERDAPRVRAGCSNWVKTDW